MAIEIIPLNGKSPYIDYKAFEESVHQVLNNTCPNAKIYLFNRFPIPISNIIDIDLLLVIIVPNKKDSYYRINENSLFQNQIIPVKFIDKYIDKELYSSDESDDRVFLTEKGEIDYQNELEKLKSGIREYLTQIFREENIIDKEEYVYIPFPIIQILSPKYRCVTTNYLLGASFDFHMLDEYFKKNTQEMYFCSIKKWSQSGAYEVVPFDIEKIVDRISKDSEYGYLTKRKIENIVKQRANLSTVEKEIGNKLIIVEGKAGNGKTNRLLTIAYKHYIKGQHILFLSYNRLLVHDINKTFQSISNLKKESKVGRVPANTFHSFFFDLCRKTGVIRLEKNKRYEENKKRYEELVNILEKSMSKVSDILNSLRLTDFDKENLKTYFQNRDDLDSVIKDYAIDYINSDDRSIEIFIKNIQEDLADLFLSNKQDNDGYLFNNDYEYFLRKLYEVLNNTSEFYKEYDVRNKKELLETSLNLNNESDEISFRAFSKHIEDIKNRLSMKYELIFVDEAQDCYEYEKEILIALFEEGKIIVANGGEEQLIRYPELCDWRKIKTETGFKTTNFQLHKPVIQTSTKKDPISISYRSKEEVIRLCNFFANKINIEFKLHSLNEEVAPKEYIDRGEIIFDFRRNPDILSIYNQLKEKAFINGYKPYESILTLITPEDEQEENSEGVSHKNKTHIYENNYVSTTNIKEKKGSWEYLKLLEDNGYQCYNGTKSKHLPFDFDHTRIIHYESCRGLETFAVCCFGLDTFFEIKYKEEKAERTLLNKTRYNNQDLTNEKRKQIYATNWLLMALTRAIDTLYIEIEDKNSDIGKLVCEYIEMNKDNKNIKVYE
ncbi:UvrD-helicase domain-containing protein [Capnocytophaga gingivalis]|uniref:UvrD-helicase domain-containing protein n=1 Tax=Capnocytophaga gingivalis TaxID=1017 RepID=UPI002889E6E3|nr:UvrD-helicase domain-containing protein [Capnocytophaga gingivalis]